MSNSKNVRTLFYLGTDQEGIFDASLLGQELSINSKIKSLQKEDAIQFNKGGAIKLKENKEFKDLNSFTIEAKIKPTEIDSRTNIAEAQKPAVAFFIDSTRKLVGSVHTAKGWQSVQSSTEILVGKEQFIRFTKDKNLLTLEIDGKEVGKKEVKDPMVEAGENGFYIGTWIDGKTYPFTGTMSNFRIYNGGITQKQVELNLVRKVKLETLLKAKFQIPKLNVVIEPDESYARLQPIKNILNAVGVKNLTELSSLNITSKVVMTPGKVMIAPKASNTQVNINWVALANSIAELSTQETQQVLAKNLINTNSVKLIKKDIPKVSIPPIGSAVSSRSLNLRPGLKNIKPISDNLLSHFDNSRTAMKYKEKLNISQTINLDENKLVIKDISILDDLKEANPALWPATSGDSMKLLSLTILPIDSAVIIANTFNLTNVVLEIAPEVETLYIIAEKIVCGANAKITWKRPGGSTPSRADDAALNGRGYSGVHQKPNSFDGLNGGDGRSGQSGIKGAKGLSAPKLEVWVKEMNSMPDFDLNGEDGIKAGRGQNGGRGGRGADGRGGKIINILVKKWCDKDPGDGGDGGNGGYGGNGGIGGNGGNGGNITISVLEGTLESTVINKSFKIKNQGGQKGRGGNGGNGGNGGYGGQSGVGEYCKNAKNGHQGAKGQPGQIGSDGYSPGNDGRLTFLEFSENAWEDLLTRPWIIDIVPDYVFPTDTIRIKGSRFTPNDKVSVGGSVLTPVINADQSLTVTIPVNVSGGEKIVYVKRQDGTESNRLRIWVKPQLDIFTSVLMPGATIKVTGKAFVNGASVILNSEAIPATFVNAKTLNFVMPGTGGTGNTESLKSLQVKNPDGMMSNIRTAYSPEILEIPFKFEQHSLPFGNFDDGSPSWGTYCDTFGTEEVWHEQLDPLFGHPILTAAFYAFYHYFLKGKSNGGLATGYCTALSAVVLDELWQGSTDTFTRYSLNSATRKKLTGIHGKLLSRESLIHFHDQGQHGNARVTQTYREIEHAFYNGCDRNNAPMLFFIPSGSIWDSGYTDKLGTTHCIVPIRFVYPQGHGGPKADGTTDLDGVRLYCWDCNRPYDPEPTVSNYEKCYLEFRKTDGEIRFDYYNGGSSKQFQSEDGITLGMMTNGAYHLADHDLPFSGPLGLTRFVIDFLLSPADLQITDESGQRTGLFGGQLLSEIPESRPCFLAKGAYMLPADTALTRRIKGSGVGTYTYNSVSPDGTSLVIEDMQTSIGQEDLLSVNADGTQIRFTPGANKNFKLTIARQVADEIRAIAVEGIGGGPTENVDITISPELSLCRVGNQSDNKTINVRAFSINSITKSHSKIDRGGVSLPKNHDLVLAVTNWVSLDLTVEAVPFN